MKEKELDALYDYDHQLLTYIPRIDEGINNIATALKDDGDLGVAIAALVSILQEMDLALNHRAEAILQMGASE